MGLLWQERLQKHDARENVLVNESQCARMDLRRLARSEQDPEPNSQARIRGKLIGVRACVPEVEGSI